MTLPRGFKANAEREAVRLRRELHLSDTEALDVDDLAAHLDVKIVSADKLVDRSRLEELERLQAYAFSAATFQVAGKNIVVTNPLRSPQRRASDVAHELSHLVLDHDLTEVREVSGMPFRTCRPDEEEQATAFGGTLMLPRPLLLSAARRQWGPTEIAERYGVTEEMARYRYNSTGVAKQARSR
ncbi:ImmA/IrrE family metallo-endopeptidase [Actinacidiphila acidipaludis]|uniref:ImmA/IrrE family metallo-endopeptidase n=1 Tax=Actinacidiphila acidipaludis TaxID=2873382 RepID=A0ABS7QHR0_9ACTN|nr:ImmA/IrrE family metallo-endopeptidase [Streptomyces acidipaludis]MBY8882714.1 ImmA/IrrE family metallo-endopeptidase [Streptomyces acidipaludis]